MEQWVGIIITLALASIGASAAAVKVAWGLRDWLATEFSATRKSFHDEMDKHEELDGKRHEENLTRFGRINTGLAVLGYKNGDR